LGKHADDPQNPGKCYCARIYGERDFKAFGYLSVLKAPYTDDRIKKHWEKAAAMNAVPIRQDATDVEKEEATKKAVEQWEKMGRTASWGCEWYKRWFELVCAAVEKKQRLKAVFFPGQVGYGIPTMEDLSDCEVDLWDGVGCGGSQKSELATANLMQKQHPGWDYEEVDVTAFLKNEFPLGAEVDALHETEAVSRWRKGIVVKQMEKVTKTESGDASTEFVWQIKCDDSGDIFEARQVRHLNVAVEQLLHRWGYILEPALRLCLPDIELRHPTACRLRSGTPALSIGIQIPNVESLLALRDRVLSGDFDRRVNEGRLLRRYFFVGFFVLVCQDTKGGLVALSPSVSATCPPTYLDWPSQFGWGEPQQPDPLPTLAAEGRRPPPDSQCRSFPIMATATDHAAGAMSSSVESMMLPRQQAVARDCATATISSTTSSLPQMIVPSISSEFHGPDLGRLLPAPAEALEHGSTVRGPSHALHAVPGEPRTTASTLPLASSPWPLAYGPSRSTRGRFRYQCLAREADRCLRTTSSDVPLTPTQLWQRLQLPGVLDRACDASGEPIALGLPFLGSGLIIPMQEASRCSDHVGCAGTRPRSSGVWFNMAPKSDWVMVQQPSADAEGWDATVLNSQQACRALVEDWQMSRSIRVNIKPGTSAPGCSQVLYSYCTAETKCTFSWRHELSLDLRTLLHQLHTDIQMELRGAWVLPDRCGHGSS
ncbi:unnamed protein product, partial [Symbiodinium sp. KB8]